MGLGASREAEDIAMGLERSLWGWGQRCGAGDIPKCWGRPKGLGVFCGAENIP